MRCMQCMYACNVCMYVCMHVMYVYIYIYIYIYVCACTHLLHRHVLVVLYSAVMSICPCVVCVGMYACVYTHIYIYIYIYIYICARVSMRVRVDAYVCAWVRVTYVDMCACDVCMCACMYVCNANNVRMHECV